jgi:DNA-binding CsgD family transcriptional regulator
MRSVLNRGVGEPAGASGVWRNQPAAGPGALHQLTPQELQIVQMAAAGLSNGNARGSRRTVESHLYRSSRR